MTWPVMRDLTYAEWLSYFLAAGVDSSYKAVEQPVWHDSCHTSRYLTPQQAVGKTPIRVSLLAFVLCEHYL
jgi:hypothetical protein